MFERALDRASRKASHAAGSAAIGFGAGIALAVGIAFWTVAAWLYLTSITLPVNAAAIIGAAYTGLACIGFVMVSVRGRSAEPQHHAAPPPEPAAETSMDNLIGAFVTGMNAGIRARSGPR